VTLDTRAALAEADRITRAALGAAKEGLADATKALERDLEELTRAAVPGRLWRAWKSEVFPKGRGVARSPVGTVFVNGGSRSLGAITFWSRPGRIKGKAGQWLAIPLPAAGSRGRGRDLSPGEWERRTGKRLRFVYRGGNRSALLVADMGTTNARTGAYRPITRARTKADMQRGFLRGEQSVPIFVLVPQVAFGNRVAVGPAIARAQTRLASAVGERLAAVR
jgi:hypothetical protein